MIGWPPSVRRLDPFEPQFRKIDRIDKRVDHSNRIRFADPVVQVFRKQRTLSAIRPFNEALHAIPRNPPMGHNTRSVFTQLGSRTVKLRVSIFFPNCLR